jgi:hypothetical protein
MWHIIKNEAENYCYRTYFIAQHTELGPDAVLAVINIHAYALMWDRKRANENVDGRNIFPQNDCRLQSEE